MDCIFSVKTKVPDTPFLIEEVNPTNELSERINDLKIDQALELLELEGLEVPVYECTDEAITILTKRLSLEMFLETVYISVCCSFQPRLVKSSREKIPEDLIYKWFIAAINGKNTKALTTELLKHRRSLGPQGKQVLERLMKNLKDTGKPWLPIFQRSLNPLLPS